jgi:hypothetical protein
MAPPINSSDAETVEEIRGLVNFARTVDRDMAISISRGVCTEAKLDGKSPRKLRRLVHVTPQVRRPPSPCGEVSAYWLRRVRCQLLETEEVKIIVVALRLSGGG